MLSKTTDALRHSGLQRANLARSAKRWLERRLTGGNKTVCAEIQGQKIQLWAHEKWRMYALLRGEFDHYMTQCFRDAVCPGDTVLDIGAHIGLYTLLAAAKAGKTGRIYAFEPEPNNYSLLTENVKANHYHNVTTVPGAVSSMPGSAELFRDSCHTGIHSFYVTEKERCTRQGVIVPLITVDEFLPGGSQVNVIKMDIEGGEPWALRGMSRTLGRSHALKLFVEINPKRLQAAGVSPEEFLAQLRDAGFDRLFLIDEKGRSLIPFATYREELVARDGGGENLLCMKGF